MHEGAGQGWVCEAEKLGGQSRVGWISPCSPTEDMLACQLNFTPDLLQQFGVNNAEALAMAEMAAFAKLVEDMHSVVNGACNGTFIVTGASIEFWKSWSELSKSALAAKFSQPVLVFNGELDTNVPLSQAQLWSNHFTSVQTDVIHKLNIPPCVTHALNCLSKSDPTKIAVDNTGAEVAPETIDAISDFVMEHAAAAAMNTSSADEADDNSPPSLTSGGPIGKGLDCLSRTVLRLIGAIFMLWWHA